MFKRNLAISWEASPLQPFDRDYKSLIDIIEHQKIATVFQPIVCLRTGMVYAYEALSRIVGPSQFSGPEPLFNAAAKYGLTSKLERLCRKTALINARHYQIEAPITLNVCPSILKCPDHEQGVTISLVEELFDVRDKVILELTERFYIHDHQLFKQTVDYYRRQGFKIAIDDLGAGFAGLNMLIQIEPYMVKIDRSLLSDINRSPKKQLLLDSLAGFCRRINTRVVAEGVETEEELSMLVELKIDFAQGYFVGRPQKQPEKPSAVFKFLKQQSFFSCQDFSNRVETLVQYQEPLESKAPVSELEQRFRDDQTLTCFPVVNGQEPVGIVHKRRFFYKLGQRYGYDLFHRKTVSSVLEPALIFDAGAPIEDVSRKVLMRDENCIYDAVIVVKEGVYLGIVTVHHLLERITEQKVDIARQVNPLTGLPGNNSIREEILRRLNDYQHFAVLYFDLDNFKPFNDNYGFDRGDFVIRYLGNVLKDLLSGWDYNSFLGHVGGDDFIAICKCDYIENLCAGILDRFTLEIKNLHDPLSMTKGYYESRDREGVFRRFPLLSLTIAALCFRENRFDTYENLISAASMVKKKAKAISGNSYLIENYPVEEL